MDSRSSTDLEQTPLLHADSPDRSERYGQFKYSLLDDNIRLISLIFAFAAWTLVAPLLVAWLALPIYILADRKLGHKLSYKDDMVWVVPLIVFDALTLAGYFWPFRELVRMAQDKEHKYASTAYVASMSFSTMAIAVLVLVPVIVIWSR